MPIRRVLLRRCALVLLGVGFLSLVVIAGSSLWLVGDTRSYSAEILESRTLRAALIRVLTSLQRAESAQRGFLLTEEPAYLDSYEKAVVQIADGYEKAATATKLEWLSTVAATQADFAREVTKAYTGAARELVAR